MSYAADFACAVDVLVQLSVAAPPGLFLPSAALGRLARVNKALWMTVQSQVPDPPVLRHQCCECGCYDACDSLLAYCVTTGATACVCMTCALDARGYRQMLDARRVTTFHMRRGWRRRRGCTMQLLATCAVAAQDRRHTCWYWAWQVRDRVARLS